ncbi:MAG: SoxR reducing system RseC family protein [Pseudomonadales bacterium]|nr:SoxR reducing system RseC family protein [Pseudomonadales bacterium]
MLSEVARVAAIDGNGLWVEARNKSQCGSCTANKTCGHSLLAKAHGTRSNRVYVLVSDMRRLQDLAVGDSVRIGIADSMILRISLLFYLSPLAGLMLFAGFAQFLGASEAVIAFSGMAGLALGFYLIRHYQSRYLNNPDYQAVLLDV